MMHLDMYASDKHGYHSNSWEGMRKWSPIQAGGNESKIFLGNVGVGLQGCTVSQFRRPQYGQSLQRKHTNLHEKSWIMLTRSLICYGKNENM
jgi:hypothetical protein